jgi:DNA transformation protein and related proteins
MDQSLFDWVAEAMAPVGVVTLRKMMGGAALYCDGVIFAMLDNGQLWFKSDAESDAVWDAAGCERFTYDFGNGRSGTMNYRRAPDDAYDDADALRRWGQLAMEAGRRVPPKKPRKKT